ncbi:MAG: tRNA epoxyqueuosine(34) reductase QueG [Candidatus Omnitrophica bacterium]|nr:tRNA epoxyqueuosine(34) reductase QueG [Candidatus Omnitrophota bacterium]
MIAKERVKALAQEIGFHACGVTLPKSIPEAEETFEAWRKQGKHGEMKYLEDYQVRRKQFWGRFSQARSVIVLGVNYFSSQTVPGTVAKKGTDYSLSPFSVARNVPGTDSNLTGRIARYAWGRDYHQVISERLELLKTRLRQEVGRELFFESAVDTKPLLERTLAQRAGLGFMGKQTQLLSLQFGPWLFLAELITDLELEPDQPFQGSCGTCRLCIDECPTDAIDESGTIDARICIAYLTIEHKGEIPEALRPKIGNWVFGCDECLNVCPYTAKQKETSWEELKAQEGFGPELHLLELFEIKSNGAYEKHFSESPISRANRKQLLRNACVVLGNLGREEATPYLKKALEDSSDLVREYAEWAIKRIQERKKGINLFHPSSV